MVNQKDPSLKIKEVILSEMIAGNKDVSNMNKTGILKGTAWRKTSTCSKRKK